MSEDQINANPIPPRRPIPPRPIPIKPTDNNEIQNHESKKQKFNNQSKAILFGILGGFALAGGLALLIIMMFI